MAKANAAGPPLPILTLISVTVLTLVTLQADMASACPRMNCAPIISKCQLIDACRCETSLNYTCFKTCSHCLGDLYSECCSCVGVCPKDDENDKSLESHVKIFDTTNEDLFDLLVSDVDLTGRWVVYHDNPITTSNSTAPMNCTMAFLVSCVDMYKCESSCISMGASGYRWFHVGCCECVGKYCLNFGANEIRCRNCPSENDQVIDSSSDNL